MKLHLGCGRKHLEGWANVDVNPKANPDICLDLNDEWPWDDNSVDEVYCNHVLEHFTPREYLKILGKMYRVCKHAAILRINVPYVSNSRYNQVNPYHLTHFNEFSFHFFDSKKMKKGPYHSQTEIELKEKSIELVYFPEWRNKPEDKKTHARKHYWNVVKEIKFVLEVVKNFGDK